MKRLLLIVFLCTLFAACQRKDILQVDTYLSNVQASLKDSLSKVDSLELDFSRAVQSRVDSAGLNVLRIPFQSRKLETDFVIVETHESGTVKRGKIVQLRGGQTDYSESGQRESAWNGSVNISSLDRKDVFSSSIVNGFVAAFHSGSSSRTNLRPSNVLPEVIITYIIQPSGGGIGWSTWLSLQSFFLDYGGNNWNGYYGSLTGGGGSAYTGGGSSTGGGNPSDGGSIPLQEPPILIDYETVLDKPEIDLQKFINCFNAIPDAGASCAIEIFADIPVDSDPNKIFNFETQSPGHTFIQLKKNNGVQSAVQNIGFYPTTGWKSILTNAPIDGKFVDNGGHEYNASFKMTLSPAQLASVLTQLLYLQNSKYDIGNYNCTDWALDVFNKVRTDKFEIPSYDIPGNIPSLGTRTPNGIYNKLRSMKKAGHPESANISYDFQKGYPADSTGPCN